jgi:hypothetical protein
MLLSYFVTSSERNFPEQLHLCCDNCAIKCECGKSDCGKFTQYPAEVIKQASKITVSECKIRQVLPDQIIDLPLKLISYYESCVHGIKKKSTHANFKTLIDIKFLVGFSEQQISQVLHNCDKLFSIEDILT